MSERLMSNQLASDWLIRNRYGFGAARVKLAAEPYRANAVQWSLREGASRALVEFERGGRRGGLGLAPILAFGLVVLLAPAIAMLPLGSDHLEIDMVLIETARLEPPNPAKPIPTTPARPEPRPSPPPKAGPKPIAPKTQPVPVAKPPTPMPSPPAPRAVPEPPARAIAKAPVERAPISLRVKPTPRNEAPRSIVRVEPLSSAPRAPKPEFTPARSRRAPVRTAVAAPSRHVARIDAVETPDDFSVADASRRHGAPAPPPASRARNARGRVPVIPGVANEPAPSKRVAAVAAPTRRSESAAPPPPTAKQRSNSRELAGVPLAALASCVSDREEDRLKQRVLAALNSRAECANAAGRYVFVETRNLNAFLMYIERAPTRKAADRCIELSLAIDCLTKVRGKETGRL